MPRRAAHPSPAARAHTHTTTRAPSDCGLSRHPQVRRIGKDESSARLHGRAGVRRGALTGGDGWRWILLDSAGSRWDGFCWGLAEATRGPLTRRDGCGFASGGAGAATSGPPPPALIGLGPISHEQRLKTPPPSTLPPCALAALHRRRVMRARHWPLPSRANETLRFNTTGRLPSDRRGWSVRA